MNTIQAVHDRAMKILAWIFLLASMSQIYYLFPVPDLAKWGSTDAIQRVKVESWIAIAMLVGFGLLAGFVALTRKIGAMLMVFSSLAYVVVWWLFSGYFDRPISLAALFADMWAFAKTNGSQLMFLHRDIVLNVYYHAMLVVLLYEMYRGRATNSAN